MEALGQGHLLTAFSCDDSKSEAWRSGVPKRVQDLLKKSTFREGCYLALKISEPGETDQLIPITHIDILEAEAVYGMQEQICEFETEASAAEIGDSLDPENLKEIVVFGVETLSLFLTD